MGPATLTIGIVNYNSGYRLRQCLESIEQHAPSCDYEVIVVDNASRDGSADFLRKEPRAGVALIESTGNLLWTAAFNLAFERGEGDIVMSLNPDMIATAGALDAIVRHFEEDATVGAIGGYTLDKQGRFERYLTDFPTPFQVFLGNYVPARLKHRAFYRPFRYDLADEDFSRPVRVPAPAGSCLAFRRSALGGPLSKEFGLFWGDVELARRIANAGHQAMVFPDALFVHDHDSAPREIRDERSLGLLLDYLVGCAAYFRKYEGRWAAFQVKLLFGAGAVATLLLKHTPRALLGREPWGMWRARARLIRDFLRDHNALLARARATGA